MSKDTIYREEAINTLADMHCKSDEDGYVWIIRSDAWARIDALPSAQTDTIPVEWIQKYADDWKDMSYAYDNPILGMLEDWRGEQE